MRLSGTMETVETHPLPGSTYGPLAELSPESTELKISISLSYFSALPLASLSELHYRLVELNILPSGWSITTLGTDQMSVCRIVRPLAAALPKIDFSLIIEPSFAWKLYFYDQRLEVDCCPTLASTSPVVKSPADVMHLVSVIESSQVCVGNPDEKFLPLMKRHQGILLGRNGEIHAP